MNKLSRKNKLSLKIFLVILLLLFTYLDFSLTRAEDMDCDQLSGDDKEKCEKLEKEAENCKDGIVKSEKTQDTLLDHIAFIDKEQKILQTSITDTRSKASLLARQLIELESDINHKKASINYQKIVLSEIVRSYYEDYQQGLLDLMLINQNFFEILNQTDYLEQAGDKTNEILSSIQKEKEELEKKQSELEQKKQENEELKEKLEQNQDDLTVLETKKRNLLVQTQGEEEKYRELLARVEQQKLELFNFSEASNLAEISASLKNYPKPDSKYWASTSWYFSQKDSRWGNKTIGNSNSLMKDYGCAITSVSMVFRHLGSSIDPGKMAKKDIFSYDLIIWPKSWSPDIDLASSTYHGNVSWSTIDKEIKKDHPVIVYIKKTNNRGGHYVVIHNKDSEDYIVHDPYFGSNLYLETSRALVGALGSNSGTKIDQMIIYK